MPEPDFDKKISICMYLLVQYVYIFSFFSRKQFSLKLWLGLKYDQNYENIGNWYRIVLLRFCP